MSISAAKRLIRQGGIDVNGVTIRDLNYKLKVGDKIRIGKKIFGVIVENEGNNTNCGSRN